MPRCEPGSTAKTSLYNFITLNHTADLQRLIFRFFPKIRRIRRKHCMINNAAFIPNVFVSSEEYALNHYVRELHRSKHLRISMFQQKRHKHRQMTDANCHSDQLRAVNFWKNGGNRLFPGTQYPDNARKISIDDNVVRLARGATMWTDPLAHLCIKLQKCVEVVDCQTFTVSCPCRCVAHLTRNRAPKREHRITLDHNIVIVIV